MCSQLPCQSKILLLFVAWILLWFVLPVRAVQPLSIDDGTEFTFEVHAATGDRLLIWIPSEAGPQPADKEIAAGLAERGIEVWRVDLPEARFLPTTQSSMDRIPASDVAGIVSYAIKVSGKRVFVAGTGRAAIPILRGMQLWQKEHHDHSNFGGVMLLSPKFFVETPDPGEAAQLMPIVENSNLPLYILQPKQSPWFWKLPLTRPALERSGSSVFLQLISGVRDRFYFRPDATDDEQQQARQLDTWLDRAMQLLASLPAQTRQVVVKAKPLPEAREGKKDRVLQVFTGDPKPPELKLQSIDGKLIDLTDLHGQVVLVNFWASWCPPCVYEMPSMQRLQDKYRQQGFIILGVNMAEELETIQTFLKTRVSIDFPVLMDSDGKALRRWQVFAFPTSYVIDRSGRIRYALFGGLEWDTPQIMHKIETLLKEQANLREN